MDTTEPGRLVNKSLITAAEEQRTAAQTRLVAAASSLAAAQTAHRAADRASQAAIANGGDALAAEIELEDAARRLNVAEKLHAAAEHNRLHAESNIHAAAGKAHLPVYQEGIRYRLAAAKKADTARAQLAEAQAAHDWGTRLLNHATENGAPHVIYDASHGAGSPVGMLEDERRRWSQPNSWWNGKPDEIGEPGAAK